MNDQSYNIWLKAYNVVGESTHDTEHVIMYELPIQPTITSADVSLNKITVNFTDASLNAYKGILGYRYSTNSGVSYTDLSANVRQFVLTNMNDQSYNIWLKAYNVVGESTHDTEHVIMYGAPSSPTITDIVGRSNSALVTFNCGNTNGSGSIDKIQYSTDGTNWVDLSGAYNDVSGSGTISLNYNNGTAYSLVIRQSTPYGGFSSSSNSVSVSPYSNTTPSAPSSLVATPGVNSVSVTFTTGNTNGSGSINKIQYSTNAGSSWIDLSGTYNDVSGSGTIPLTYKGSNYSIVLRQSTPYGGYSAASASVAVSPNGFLLPPTITSTEVVSTQITVNFTDASSNTGKGVLGYKYSYNEGATYTTLAANATQFVLSDMTLPSYTIWLKTYNAISESSNAETVVTMNTTIDPPTITSVVPGNLQVQVFFTPGDINSLTLTGYKYSTNGTTYSWANETSSPLVITGLSAGTAYTVTIKSIYSNAASSVASNVSNSVIPYDIPYAPTIVNITPGDGVASVYYTDGSSNGSPVTMHQYSLNGDDYIDVSYASPIQLTGLINGNPYVIDVKSVNIAGQSVSSNSIAFIPYTVPSKPIILNVIPLNNKASVYVQHGNDNGSDITGYSYSINNAAFVSVGNANTCFDISGLTNGTSYNIRVIATNAAGNSAVSDHYQVTPAGVPEAPTSLNTTPISDGVSISFTDGASNGRPITYYLYSLNGGEDIPIQKNSAGVIHIFDLLNITNYSLRLRAVNNAGASSYSSPVTWLTQFDEPLVPHITHIIPGNGVAYLYFDESITTGSPIEQFYYSLNGLQSVPLNTANLTSPLTIPSLMNKNTYNISIVARNGGNYSNVSNTKSVNVGAPHAPVVTRVVPGSRHMRVYFNVPSDNGFPIIEYLYGLNEHAFTGKTKSLADASGSYLYIPHVSNGRSYVVYICAINVNGMSLRSNVLSPVIPADVPDTIKIAKLTPYLAGSLVYFYPPVNNGETITKYKYAFNSSTEFIDASGTTLPLEIYNTPINTPFSIRLIATNKAGDSIVSASSRIVTFVYLPPSQIRVSSLNMPTKNSLQVSFSSPALNGSYITKYKYALNGSNNYIDASGTGLPLLITNGIEPNTDYNIQVIAVNSVMINNGESIPSIPLANPIRYTYLLPENAPLVSSIVGKNSSAIVTFTAPRTRGAPIIGYAYSFDEDGLIYTDISSGVSSHLTITGLTNDRLYNMRIAAKTDIGYSPLSIAIPVTPIYKAPSAPIITKVIKGSLILTVVFNIPSENGAPITGYNYTLNGGESIPVLLNPDGISFVIMKNVVNGTNVLLTNGTRYSVRMTAINEVGESQNSPVKFGTPAYQ